MANGKPDYYDLLGVDKGASEAEVKRAYRKQALEWHPDRHKDNKEAAEKRFKEINEAYQILADPKKRQAYDQFGHQAFVGGFGRQGTGGFGGQQAGRTGPFTYTYTTSGGQNPFGGFDFGDPFEIFEQFFGGSGPFRQAHVPRYSITVNFMDAVSGVEKEVEIGGKKRKIKIPPGVDDGSRIQFDDFMLSINVRPHEVFERDGADVYVKQLIPYSTVLLGGTIEVPTVEGKVKIKVRAGTPFGTTVRLRGKGIPHLHGRGMGDQYVRLVVDVPQGLSRSQKKLVQELKKVGL